MSPTLKANLISVGKGAAIAALGAALAVLSDFATGQSAGIYGPVLSAVLAIAVNALRKFAAPAPAPATPPVAR